MPPFLHKRALSSHGDVRVREWNDQEPASKTMSTTSATARNSLLCAVAGLVLASCATETAKQTAPIAKR